MLSHIGGHVAHGERNVKFEAAGKLTEKCERRFCGHLFESFQLEMIAQKTTLTQSQLSASHLARICLNFLFFLSYFMLNDVFVGDGNENL